MVSNGGIGVSEKTNEAACGGGDSCQQRTCTGGQVGYRRENHDGIILQDRLVTHRAGRHRRRRGTLRHGGLMESRGRAKRATAADTLETRNRRVPLLPIASEIKQAPFRFWRFPRMQLAGQRKVSTTRHHTAPLAQPFPSAPAPPAPGPPDSVGPFVLTVLGQLGEAAMAEQPDDREPLHRGIASPNRRGVPHPAGCAPMPATPS